MIITLLLILKCKNRKKYASESKLMISELNVLKVAGDGTTGAWFEYGLGGATQVNT